MSKLKNKLQLILFAWPIIIGGIFVKLAFNSLKNFKGKIEIAEPGCITQGY